MGDVREIKADDWKAEVLDATLPVLVDFFATWCGPCRYVAPVVEQLSKEMAGKVSFAKLDIDQAPDLTVQLGIEGVPTLVLFNAGKEVARMVGASPKPAIKSWLEEHLAS